MAKTYKRMTFAERCENNKYKVTPYITPQKDETYQTVQIVHDGKVTKRLKKVVNDAGARLAKYKVSDFSINNLNAVGAQLQPTIMHHDTHTNVDIAETQLNNIINSQINK